MDLPWGDADAQPWDCRGQRRVPRHERARFLDLEPQDRPRVSALFSTLRLRGLELKNRVVLSPMQQYSATEGFADDWHLVHLGSRAVGGAGLLITESAAVSQEARSTTGDLGMWREEQVEPWTRINAFVHARGAKIAMQLGHFGSKGSRAMPQEGFAYLPPERGGWPTVSASAVAPFAGMSEPRALDILELAAITADFAASAKRATAAGFDAIELHFAHGYLVHQFLSRLINCRTDCYGGSFANRTRFALKIVAEVRAVIPEAMPLLVRLSAVDYVDDERSWSLEDSVALARELRAAGVDLITASAGGFAWVDKSVLRPGYQAPYAAAIREGAGVATGAVGLINSAHLAERIVASGQADLAVVARAHLRNPYFATSTRLELGLAPEMPWQYERGY